MKNITHIKFYNLIKINPSSEIWLKSMRVKIRMLKTLMQNVKISLTRSKISFHKYQLSKDSARIFFFLRNEDINKALEVLKNVFGIYSFSPALRTSNKLKNIIERTLEVGKEIIEKNDTFALRVKRSGIHEYTSQDIAIKVGQEVMDAYSHLNLKVDLSNPKKKIYIEIRGEFSYIYTDIIKTEWGGMPIEKKRKVLCMDIGRLNDLLAGFSLMRRGCELYPILFEISNENNNCMEKRIFNWRELVKYTHQFNFIIRKINISKILEKVKEFLIERKYFCSICRLIRFDILSKLLKESEIEDFDLIRAITDGVSLNNTTLCTDNVDLESIALNYLFSEYPIFTPIIGLDFENVENFTTKISRNLKSFNYCKFKPKNQEINIEEIKILYKSLNLKDLIEQSLYNIEEYDIF